MGEPRTTGATGADRLTPRARAFLWRHRRKTAVVVTVRSGLWPMTYELANCGWLELISSDRVRSTYTVVAVPVVCADVRGTGVGNNATPDQGVRTVLPADRFQHHVGERAPTAHTVREAERRCERCGTPHVGYPRMACVTCYRRARGANIPDAGPGPGVAPTAAHTDPAPPTRAIAVGDRVVHDHAGLRRRCGEVAFVEGADVWVKWDGCPQAAAMSVPAHSLVLDPNIPDADRSSAPAPTPPTAAYQVGDRVEWCDESAGIHLVGVVSGMSDDRVRVRWFSGSADVVRDSRLRAAEVRAEGPAAEICDTAHTHPERERT